MHGEEAPPPLLGATHQPQHEVRLDMSHSWSLGIGRVAILGVFEVLQVLQVLHLCLGAGAIVHLPIKLPAEIESRVCVCDIDSRPRP